MAHASLGQGMEWMHRGKSRTIQGKGVGPPQVWMRELLFPWSPRLIPLSLIPMCIAAFVHIHSSLFFPLSSVVTSAVIVQNVGSVGQGPLGFFPYQILQREKCLATTW